MVIFSLCMIELSIVTPFCITFVIGYKSDRYRMVNTSDDGDDGDGGSGRP